MSMPANAVPPRFYRFFCGLVCIALLNNPVASATQIKHDPVGASDRLIVFQPKIFDFPIKISYPENWYAKEADGPWGVLITYLTPAPLSDTEREYKTGVMLVADPNYDNETLPKPFSLQDHFEKIKKSIPNIQNTQNFKIDGFDAVKLEFPTGLVVLTHNGHYLVTIFMTYSEEERTQHIQRYNQLIDALSWKPIQASGDHGSVGFLIQTVDSKGNVASHATNGWDPNSDVQD